MHSITSIFHNAVGVGLACLTSLLAFSSCYNDYCEEADEYNDLAYSYHYRDLDSVETMALRAFVIADSAGYYDSKAEALNNLAFVATMRMEYADADSLLSVVPQQTDNLIELLVADVQKMRLCQRRGDNKEFYEFRERAQRLITRIREEDESLSPHARRRMVYAETEFHIVTSTYFYYIGLSQPSLDALMSIDESGEIRGDTAQYINYLYNVGVGGTAYDDNHETTRQKEMESLLSALLLAERYGYKFFVANALEALSELTAGNDGAELMSASPAMMELIRGVLAHEGMTDPTMTREGDTFPIAMAEMSLFLFSEYGDVYQTAASHRSLAACYMATDDYDMALYHLGEALADARVEQSPSLMASIRELLSVAYSAIDDKQMSDYNRNIYLDLQEESRQDRYLEARAEMLSSQVARLNITIAAVGVAIVVLVLLLWLFRRLHKRDNKDETISQLLLPLERWQEENRKNFETSRLKMEQTREEGEVARQRLRDNERGSLEQRAKLSLACSVTPLIDRIINETRFVAKRDESPRQKAERYAYISELAAKIIDYNNLLTEWIKMRQGRIGIKIETFSLSPLLQLLRKGKTSFSLKGINLIVDDTDAKVKADRVLTLFMINTLADNARKFTPEGGSVHIYASEGDNYVELSVEDTGCGIPEKRLAEILKNKTPIAPSDNSVTIEGHGFGLLNCRGIIEKYRKTSRKMECCMLSAESKEGKGSRFFFRLPKGIGKALALMLIALLPLTSHGRTMLEQAADYADSAYYANINGDYYLTVEFADSCRQCLNAHYLSQHKGAQPIMLMLGPDGSDAPEIYWFRDSVDTDYNIILDMRNETAVAALALHDWELYRYNNSVFTQLYKELSADKTLETYCDTMLESQNNRNIAIIILVAVLLSILPAYYLLYYRHRLYFKLCVEKIKSINNILQTPSEPEQKLKEIRPIIDYEEKNSEQFPQPLREVMGKIEVALANASAIKLKQQEDWQTVEDQTRKTQMDADNLHVCNSIVDNCLSTLKHETMYYPSRIEQLTKADSPDINAVGEVALYYRDLYSILCLQAIRQTEKTRIPLETVRLVELGPSADVTANPNLIAYLFEILRKTTGKANIYVRHNTDDKYVVITVAPGAKLPTIPFLLCRQIARDLSEITNRRRCGIEEKTSPDGGKYLLDIILPKASRGKTPKHIININDAKE